MSTLGTPILSVEERKAIALEAIAKALADAAIIMQKRLDKEFPEQTVVQYPKITHIPTDKEQLELEQRGDDDEEYWGQRERDFLAQTRNKSSQSS